MILLKLFYIDQLNHLHVSAPVQLKKILTFIFCSSSIYKKKVAGLCNRYQTNMFNVSEPEYTEFFFAHLWEFLSIMYPKIDFFV